VSSTKPPKAPLPHRVGRRLTSEARELIDEARGRLITARGRWPCLDRKYLLVGSESSGTSAVADLLFADVPGLRLQRFNSRNPWVWDAYKCIYQGQAGIRDYPRLQLSDAIKVPGFATIIEQFREGFPNTSVIYMVRDPRDFVSSAFRTWRSQGVDDPNDIPWVSEDWLGIPERDPVARLCLRWKAYLQSATEAGDVIFVRYEDFCGDKMGVIRGLAERIDLPVTEERVRARKDDQLAKARDYLPRGPGSWRDDLSSEDVSTIEGRCSDEMRRWHYLP
jgi:hypothetical protein